MNQESIERQMIEGKAPGSSKKAEYENWLSENKKQMANLARENQKMAMSLLDLYKEIRTCEHCGKTVQKNKWLSEKELEKIVGER